MVTEVVEAEPRPGAQPGESRRVDCRGDRPTAAKEAGGKAMKPVGAQVRHPDDYVAGVRRTRIPFPLTLPNGALNELRLTTRELEVLRLIAEGRCNKQI